MNELILRGARRSRGGLIDRLRGSELSEDRQSGLNEAMSAYEAAARRRDEVGMERADARIDMLLSEARAARQQAEPPPEAISFDGGVRRAVRPYSPPDMNAYISRRAMERNALRAEAAEWA